jgi:hypothetical protein
VAQRFLVRSQSKRKRSPKMGRRSDFETRRNDNLINRRKSKRKKSRAPFLRLKRKKKKRRR